MGLKCSGFKWWFPCWKNWIVLLQMLISIFLQEFFFCGQPNIYSQVHCTAHYPMVKCNSTLSNTNCLIDCYGPVGVLPRTDCCFLYVHSSDRWSCKSIFRVLLGSFKFLLLQTFSPVIWWCCLDVWSFGHPQNDAFASTVCNLFCKRCWWWERYFSELCAIPVAL